MPEETREPDAPVLVGESGPIINVTANAQQDARAVADGVKAEVRCEAPRDFTREITFHITDTRDAANGDGLTFDGYAAVFDQPTEINSSLEGHFLETIKPGAFKKTLREKTPVLMFDHGNHPVMGTMPIGSITRATEDHRGLRIQARLHDNWLTEPIRDAIRSGAVSGMSFRFAAVAESWIQPKKSTDLPQRELREVKVPELGPVVFPAYSGTSASVRSAINAIAQDDTLRSVLIDVANKTPDELRAEDDDTDVGALAQAIDAAIDEAIDEFDNGNVDQGIALVRAADIAVDQLLDVLNVPDADEDEMNSTALTGETREEQGTPSAAAPPSTADGAAVPDAPAIATQPTQHERRTAYLRFRTEGITGNA